MDLLWCDMVAATPLIGVSLNRASIPGNVLLERLQPILDRNIDGDEDLFTLKQVQAFGVHFSLNSGLNYSFDPSRGSVEFAHFFRLKRISGAPPTMEMTTEPKPFSKKLADITEDLSEAIKLTNTSGDRTIKRLGIVCSASIDEGDAPPGIRKLLKYIGAPWDDGLDVFLDVNFTTIIRRHEDYVDRCIHRISRAENEDQLLTVKLDFQRLLRIPVGIGHFDDHAPQATKAAMRYFEELGQGDRFHD